VCIVVWGRLFPALQFLVCRRRRSGGADVIWSHGAGSRKKGDDETQTASPSFPSTLAHWPHGVRVLQTPADNRGIGAARGSPFVAQAPSFPGKLMRRPEPKADLRR